MKVFCVLALACCLLSLGMFLACGDDDDDATTDDVDDDATPGDDDNDVADDDDDDATDDDNDVTDDDDDTGDDDAAPDCTVEAICHFIVTVCGYVDDWPTDEECEEGFLTDWPSGPPENYQECVCECKKEYEDSQEQPGCGDFGGCWAACDNP